MSYLGWQKSDEVTKLSRRTKTIGEALHLAADHEGRDYCIAEMKLAEAELMSIANDLQEIHTYCERNYKP